MFVALLGPPSVITWITPKVSKKAYTIFITIKKKAVGDNKGKVIVQKRFSGEAPSIAAASIKGLGIA